MNHYVVFRNYCLLRVLICSFFVLSSDHMFGSITSHTQHRDNCFDLIVIHILPRYTKLLFYAIQGVFKLFAS